MTAEPGGLWHQPALMNLLADLLMLAAIAALSWAAIAFIQRMPIFPLREIILADVPQRVSRQQLEDVAHDAVAGNFFTVNLEAVRAAFEKLPWVRKVSLRRNWPDGLMLTIEEHEAQAQWRHLDGSAALVNRQGELFNAERTEQEPRLPLLSGPEDSAAELLGRYMEFNTALAPVKRHIDSVVLSQRQAWQLRLDNGVIVELGRDQEKHPIGERLERFVAHYPATIARTGAIRVADMRYPSGFALVTTSEHSLQPTRSNAPGRKS